MRTARQATVNDIPTLLYFAFEMHSESRYAKFRLSNKKLKELFRILLTIEGGILLISDHGFLAGLVEEYWFSHDLHANEVMLYVMPECRGNGEAVSLVRAYIERAKELGAKDVHIEDTTMVHSERNERFFTKMGFKRVGGNFLLEAN